MKSGHVIPLLLAGILVATLSSNCSRFSPTLEDAQVELGDLLLPAVKVVEERLGSAAVRDSKSIACQEPAVGPADGLRPVLEYNISDLAGVDPEEILGHVEEAWTDIGLSVERVNEGDSKSLQSGKDGYSIEAFFQSESRSLSIGGTGPCVEGPET